MSVKWGTVREVGSGEIEIYILYMSAVFVQWIFYNSTPFEFLLFWAVQLNIQEVRKKKEEKCLWWVQPIIHMLIFNLASNSS